MSNCISLDPTTTRLSDSFLLSDFLGNHSAYTRGLPNMLAADDSELPLKMANAQALCRDFLEPFLQQAGPLSISYGYITPEMSDEIVHYQDSRKPSHHMWNLGAACDIVCHEWVNHDAQDDTAASSPVLLAHEIITSGYPFSRMITYAESPYLCMAVSAAEVAAGHARHAFYENRYVGKKQPDYRTYSSSGAKRAAYDRLRREGMVHGWRGQGYPSYHGHGKRQYHHIRVSDYTMLSDWLFDLQSIANGAKNIPNVTDQTLMDAFYRAGDIYDDLIRSTGINRFSIIGAFVARSNPYFDSDNDWSKGRGYFLLTPPASASAADIILQLKAEDIEYAGASIVDASDDDGELLRVDFEVPKE